MSQIEYRFPVIERAVGGVPTFREGWRWVTFASPSGNKYEALLAYKQKRLGENVQVVADDMSQANSRWLS